MDELDKKILGILRENARASFTEIGRGIGASEGTARARVRRLVDDGTIRQFTIRTSGAHVKALIEVNVTANVNTDHVAATVRDWEGVETVWEVTGDNDVLVVADCPTIDSLNHIIDRIRDVEGIEATRSRLILKEH